MCGVCVCVCVVVCVVCVVCVLCVCYSCICIANSSRWEMLIIGEISWTAVRFMPVNNWKVCFHRFPFVNIKTRPGEKWCMLLHFRNLATKGKNPLKSILSNKRRSTHWAKMQRVLRPRLMTCIMETYCIEIVCGRIPGMKRMGRFDPRPGVPSSPSARRLTARPHSLSDRHTYKRHWMKFAYL